MKILKCLLVLALVVSFNGPVFSADDEYDEKPKRDSGSSALGGALLGGLLGAGLGAAIGSASGKAGTGAAIGGGVGAIGGTLLAAEKERNTRAAEAADARANEYVEQPTSQIPKGAKVKKRIVREYDSDGNVVSEKEVAN